VPVKISLEKIARLTYIEPEKNLRQVFKKEFLSLSKSSRLANIGICCDGARRCLESGKSDWANFRPLDD
jgi:hypothetical protein